MVLCASLAAHPYDLRSKLNFVLKKLACGLDVRETDYCDKPRDRRPGNASAPCDVDGRARGRHFGIIEAEAGNLSTRAGNRISRFAILSLRLRKLSAGAIEVLMIGNLPPG